ncbi:hypothetical protein GOV09_04745 [Candidatus Woesearchaeota archaeon]|nr:hypothetical protein [Candidatus Woesearchaeota archaeon]
MKFECAACGTCCSLIQGFVSEEEKRFIEEFGYGKLPLIQLTKVEDMTFPLWDFEAKRFLAYAKELGIDPKIIPSRAIFDLGSNSLIIVTYQMNARSCPFLKKEGKCSIYGKERAFVCNLFPFNRSPFLNIGSEHGSLFGKCRRIKDILPTLDFKNKEVLIKQLYEIFGDTFLASVQHDHITEWSNKIILEMMKKKVIRPALNYPYDKLQKRIEHAEKKDFFEFLSDSGFMAEKEVDALTKRFRNYEDAREKMEKISLA